MVVTHHAGDLNIDHKITHQAVITACRPIPGQTVKRILSFEVPTATECSPPMPGHVRAQLVRGHYGYLAHEDEGFGSLQVRMRMAPCPFHQSG